MDLDPLQDKRLRFCLNKAANKTKPTQRHDALTWIEDARSLTFQIDDAESRIDALNEIAATCQSIGLTDFSCQLLEEVLQEIEQVTYPKQSHEREIREDMFWSIQVQSLMKAGETYLQLGLKERGLPLIERSLEIQKSHRHEDDLDEHFRTLGEIAYLYGTAGLMEEAIAIAREIDEYHAAFDFYLQLSWYCLREDEHERLIQTLLASAWTGYQGHIAYEVAKFCQESKSLFYVKRLISEIDQATTKIYLMIGSARVMLWDGQIDSGLSILEQADALILAIHEGGLRQTMRDTVEASLDHYLEVEEHLTRRRNSKSD